MPIRYTRRDAAGNIIQTRPHVVIQEPVAVADRGVALGTPPVHSPATDPYYAPPFAGAYLAPVPPQSSPSMMNTPPLGVTQQTDIQAEVNAPTSAPSAPRSFNWWDTASNLVGALVAAGASPTPPAAPVEASASGLAAVPSWLWLTMGGFAFYLFAGRKNIEVRFARSGKRKRRKKAHV